MRHRSSCADEPDLLAMVEMNDDDQCTAISLTD